MKFIDLAPKQQLRLLNQVNAFTNQDQITIEKDWWVTQVLKAIFALPYAKELSFKGGTSLSKAWEIIDRFSEDIDIAISREYLGFGGELSKNQVSDRLRRASCTFVRETMKNDIHSQLVSQGISEDLFDVKVNITPISTTLAIFRTEKRFFLVFLYEIILFYSQRGKTLLGAFHLNSVPAVAEEGQDFRGEVGTEQCQEEHSKAENDIPADAADDEHYQYIH